MRKKRPIEVAIKMLAIGLLRYAECANVSNKKPTKCENTTVETAIKNGLSLRIFCEIRSRELYIIPKIPPKDQYNIRYSFSIIEHLTFNRKKSIKEKEPPTESQIKA